MTDGEMLAALIGSGVTALAILVGIPLARWLGAKRRKRLAAAKEAEIDALIDAAFERITKLEKHSKSKR